MNIVVFASQKMAKSWLRLATICLRSIDMKDIIICADFKTFSLSASMNLRHYIKSTLN